ncbi:MAG: sensor histidine kinase [Bacteroidales bacterium]|jgi:nitrogen fixation/metabolism regulation signal transduction histidine kinase|nr:sensor histidine kinase [Bacteroidales bacterium]
MTYRKIKLFILSLMLLFGAGCVGTAFLFFKEWYLFGIIALIALLLFFLFAFSRIMTGYDDLRDFSEAVQYHDFTGGYSKMNDLFLKNIKKIFLNLNIEKETQQQYLKLILEVVDTGILTYDMETQDIFLSNEALQKILQIPRIKNLHWIKSRNKELYDSLVSLEKGNNTVLTLNIKNQIVKILVNASSFQTMDGKFKLIAFQNMNATFEEVEATAWKRLLSVMTHEIMNSIAPVSSLADTINHIIVDFKEKRKKLDVNDLEDIETGIETIKNRSDGLLQFAKTYRNLYKPITLNLEWVDIDRLFRNIYRLMSPMLQQQEIDFEIITESKIPPFEMDSSLIEQVLINLILNASDAVKSKDNPHIILSAGVTSESKLYMTVVDNGDGIPAEQIDNIFIPFFSTKKKGNGIGLSLSRQIVKLHKGTMQLQSKTGEGSAFTILL